MRLKYCEWKNIYCEQFSLELLSSEEPNENSQQWGMWVILNNPYMKRDVAVEMDLEHITFFLLR